MKKKSQHADNNAAGRRSLDRSIGGCGDRIAAVVGSFAVEGQGWGGR